MALEVIMPKAGVDMTEGQIVQWNKKVGEFVKEGEILLEIMTDKVSMELEAEEDGYLIAILKGDGETVPVTEVIGYLGEEGENIPTAGAAAPESKPVPTIKKSTVLSHLAGAFTVCARAGTDTTPAAPTAAREPRKPRRERLLLIFISIFFLIRSGRKALYSFPSGGSESSFSYEGKVNFQFVLDLPVKDTCVLRAYPK